MSCRQYRRMLLSREEEYSREEVAALLAHLAGCASCAREAAEESDAEKQIRVIRAIPVGSADPGELTQRILRATTGQGQQHVLSHSERSKSGLLDHASVPAMSFAAAAMVLVVVASALGQVAVVLGEVRQLEVRQSLQSVRSRPAPTVAYAVDARQASEILGPDIMHAAGTPGTNGTIIVSEQALAAVRVAGMSAELHLPRLSMSARAMGPLRSWRPGVSSMVRPVLSFRNAEGV